MVVKSKKMGWAGHVACMRLIRNAYKILAGKLEGRRPFRRPNHRWEDGIKMDLRELEQEGVD
jgi:hypothetical protein